MARPRKHPLPEVPGAAFAKAKKLTSTKVAAMVGVEPITIRRWSDLGIFPRAVELVPGELRWTEPDVLAWIAEREKGPAIYLAKRATPLA